MRQGAGAAAVTIAAVTLALLLVTLLLTALPGCDDDGPPPTAPDTTPPAVLAFEPADGAVAVPDSALLRVVFDEPVVLDSLATTTALRLRGPDGAPLPGDTALDSTATILTFTPATALPVPADLEAVLAAGIADLSGNARPDSAIVRFTTAFAFEDYGRLFFANEIGHDLTVIDVATLEPAPGSPLQLPVIPERLHGVLETGELYVLYRTGVMAGLLVVDARTLTVLRNSGPVLDPNVTDFIVLPEHDLLVVASPADNALLVLDPVTFAPRRDPLVFVRADAEPARFAVTRRFDWLLVGLDGGAQLAAYTLPALVPVPGFPVLTVERIHTITVEEERARAWVGGSERYALVDLINPDRTFSLQMEQVTCNGCTPQLWALILSPVRDRVYFLYRRQAVASIVLSTLAPAPESPGGTRLNYFLTDLVEHPRSGELLVLGWANLDTPVFRIDPATLDQIGFLAFRVGDKAVDMELMP